MDAAVLKLEKELTWPLIFQENDSDINDVSCDPVTRKHIFSVPRDKGKNSYGFVRCLCHALLAEKVHPLFSAVIVEGPDVIPENLFKSRIWPVFCVSRDWFADAFMRKLYPLESRREICSRLAFMESEFPGGQVDGDFSSLLRVALVLAEAEHLWQANFNLNGEMREMADIFRRVDPMTPDIGKLERLNDSLLKRYSAFSAELVEKKETGGAFWRVF